MDKFDDIRNFSPLQRDLIAILEKNGPMTRSELVSELKKPRTTIYDALKGLMHARLLRSFSRPTNSNGRPVVFFKLSEL